MSKGRQGGSSSKSGRPSVEEWPEVMKLRQALRYLGVSHQKITALVHSGALPFSYSELDHRVKLVKRSDLDALKQKSQSE